MAFAFDPAPRPFVAIGGGDGEFPVRRIWCVGQNYAGHVREMGAEVQREQPMFFSKPADAVVASGSSVPYPPMTENFHHEVELVVAIGKAGENIAAETANEHIFGYAVGLDLTRRDLQSALRKKGWPWDMAKGFDRSAPIGAIARAEHMERLGDAAITLKVNDELRQSSRLGELIWSIPELIHWLSRYVALAPGDLLFTGTPSGVGPLKRGDALFAHIDGLPDLEIAIG